MSSDSQFVESNDDTNLPPDAYGQKKDKTPHASESSNYVDTCVTVAKAIRWLTFALSLCSGSLLLLLVTNYHGNLKYAIERRKEIHKKCFEDGIKDVVCDNFINDVWEIEPRFPSPTPAPFRASIPLEEERAKLNQPVKEPNLTPLPMPAQTLTPSPSPTVTPLEIIKTNFAEAQNETKYKAYRELEGEINVIQLPLINVKLLYTDFAIILVLLSIFFLYWLRLNLEFARNTLCSLYNDALSASQATRTVPAHFLLLWPGGSRRRSHWVFWFILYSTIVSGLILIATDISDFFFNGFFSLAGRHFIPISHQAGWEKYQYYAFGKMLIEVFLITGAGYIIYRLHSIVRDVRNLLMLIEWAPKAFHPLLYHLFDKQKTPLLKGANETSYDEYGPGFFCLRIRLTFFKNPSEPKPTETIENYFYARVNLWKSASNKSSHIRLVEWDDLFSKEEWVHSLAEERRMRLFFFNILTNPYIEREVCFEFWKTAKDHGLQEEWIEKCKKEFSEETNKPQATTDEIVKRTEHYRE